MASNMDHHTNSSTSLDEPDNQDIATTVVQATTLSLIFLIVCFLNFLVTFTFYKKAYLMTPSNRFVFSLTLSNFVGGVVVLPFNLISCLCHEWIFGVMWCNLTGFVTVSVTAGSLLTLTIITVDRYFAISQPMMYPIKVTCTRTVELIVLVWILALVCSLPPVFGWSQYRYNQSRSSCFINWSHHPSYAVFFSVAYVCTPLLIMSWCYVKILQVAHVHKRRVSNGSVVATGTLRNRRGSRRTSLLVNIRMSSPFKAMRTVVLTMGAFCIIWGPVTVELLYEAFNGILNIPHWVLTSVTSLWYASFIMHPLVYAVWNRSIRRELLSWFCSRGRWLDDEMPLFAPRNKETRAVSISGSIGDLSFATSVQNKASSLGVTTGATLPYNSSNDSGTVLTCIEESDDVGDSGDLILRMQPNSLARRRPATKGNPLQTVVDVHTPIGFIQGSQDSLEDGDKISVIGEEEDCKDEGILEDA
ncbi:G-protein coupled receptor 161-like [Asterias rubens]|uniref:G-protein coupled receptor 161-like n=1 Tax=Asterias rubens TaxID=7604 RepID=UPI001455C4B1|nr:G-protein coupled receptor 161-like [Asterias rubens]